ncbi:MAG TPA: hypothetical protein VKQ28_16825 [Candidatus Acidoferrum sp.]|nr:hypothetical protein [Candidatus Acidoferrum sp.]
MPTTLKQVKARIQAIVQAADANAKVYTYRRNLTAESDMAQFTGADSRVHFWHIYRENVVLSDLVINQDFVQQDDLLVIEGFLGVFDADDTEEIFDANVDAVLQSINADRRSAGGTKLNGLVSTASTPKMRKMDFVEYGQTKVLCHHAEIAMTVTPRYLQ